MRADARSALAAALLAVSLGFGGCGSDEPEEIVDGATVKVLTRNLFLGSDLTTVVMSPTVEEVPVRAAALWQAVMDTDFPARAERLAEEIVTAQPDLVGLQEVELFRLQRPSDFSFEAPVINASETAIDFLEVLMAALTARTASYRVALVVTNTDVELPAGPADARFDIRLTDRDVILAREGIATDMTQGAPYMSHVVFPLPLSGERTAVKVTLVRGLGTVQAVVDGARLTFGNTHLEVGGGPGGILTSLQEGQAENLIDALAGTQGPVVLVGDFNSAADRTGTRSYATVAGGFKDAHAVLMPPDPGLTCCSDLRADAFMGSSRIDIVFYRGRVAARAIEVVGTDPVRRTPSGLWPSDHAGVLATLIVERP